MNALRSARAPFLSALLLTLAGLFPVDAVAQTATPRDLHIITPCRVYDSRLTGGPLTSGAVRDVNMPAACSVPDDAQAIIVNLTVVDPPSAGYIQVYKGGGSIPGANVLTFNTAEILGQFFVVEMGTDPDLHVRLVMGAGTTHFVIDVLAYHGSGAPTDIELSNNTVLENEPADTLVGTLSTIDPDFDDTHTYTLVAGAGDTDNAKFKITGDQLLTDEPLDREAQQTYSIRVRSADNFGVALEEVFTIEATNENDVAPVLTAGATLAYSEGDPATAIDATITVNDGDSPNLASATVQITGNYQNGQDVLSFVDTATITAAAFDTVTGTLTLTGTDTLANWQAALRSVRYNNTSDNPSALQRTVTWIATDDGGLSSTGVTSAISLSSTNSRPTITEIGDQTIDEDTSTAALPFTIGDAETAAASLTVAGTSSNPALIPNGNIVFGGSGANRTVTVTPAANANGGPVTITITVDDGSATANATVTETFDVTITAINDQPTITPIGDQTIDEDTSTGALAFTIADEETAAGTLTVTATSSNQTLIPDANVVIGGTGANRTVTVTPAANQSGGPVTITITVGDGTASAVETFTVTVNNVNDQPTIGDVTDQTIDEDTSTGALAFTVGDAETAAASLTLIGTSSNPALIPNANIVFGGSGANRTVTVTPAANASGGPVTITITVNDGSGAGNATASDTFQITINAINDQPTITPIADQTIDEDTSTGALAFTIGDAETAAGSLTVTATSSDQTLIPNANIVIGGTGASRTVTVTPAANQSGGPVTITITVGDGTASAVETFTVTVNNVNDQPTITGIGNQTIDEDTSTGALAFTIGDIETAAATLTVTAASSNGTIIPDANIVIGGSGANRTVTVTPAANQFGGPVTITLTVDDGSGAANAANSTAFTVTVASINDVPTITGIANQTIDEDTSTGALAFTVGDVETAAASLTVTASSSNTGIIPNANIVIGGSGANRTVTVTPAANQFGGPVTITITVSDGAASPSTAFTVTVNPVNDPPVAGTDTFETFGNTELRVDLETAGTTPHIPVDLVGNPGVRNNDSDPVEGTPVTVSGVVGCADVTGPTFGDSPACATANGGQVILASDGSFQYFPPQANPAVLATDSSDSFQYTIVDGEGAPATGLVNLTRREVIWYVDPTAAAGGDGRSHRPLQTFTGLNGAGGAGDSDNADDYILVHDGTINSAIELEAGQRLIGQGVGLSLPLGSLGSFQLLAPTTQPQITNASGDAVRITAAVPARIAGLSLAGSVNAIDMQATGALTGSGTLAIENNTFRNAGAEGIDVNAGATGTLTLSLQNNTWNPAGTHTGNAVDVLVTNGNLRLDLGNNSDVLSTGASAIVAVATAPGTMTITGLANNTVHQNTAGSGIVINAALFDATPGGAVNRVYAGATRIGVTGDGVGGAGLSLTNVTGDLAFGDATTPGDLDVFSAGTALTATSTVVSGFPQLRLTVMPTDNAGTSTLASTGGAAVDIDSVTADLRLSAMTSTNGLKGVSLVRVLPGSPAATFPAIFRAPSGSSITTSNAAATAFRVDQSNATVTYQGTINTTAGRGVDLTSNTGSTIGFSGALTLSSGTNPAFTATGGGTVTATDMASTLTTTTATALNVASTTIGAGGLRFRSISSNGGGSSGIVLSNTGSSGGLAVGGNGGTCTTAASCTGGAIQNKTVDGISLNNTRGVSLTRMFIDNNDGSGIFGDDVTDFSLINSMVTNNADTATGAEAGLRFNELLGNCAITNTTISGSSEDEIRITPTSGVLANLAISGSTIGPNNATTGGNGITFSPTVSAEASLTVTGGVFQNIRASALLVNGDGTTRRNVTVSGATFRDSNSGVHVLGSFSGDLTFEVTGNTFLRHALNPIQVVIGSTSTNAMQVVGEISGNVIGDGTPNSGATDLHGIAVEINGDADAIVSITNNSVSNTDIDGIFVQTRLDNDADAETGRLDLTLRDNDVNTPDDNSAFPFGAAYGTRVESRNTTTICLDVAGNSSASVGGLEHFRTRQRDTSTFIMERLTDGDGTPGELITNLSTVEAFLVGQNDGGSTADATQQTVATGYTEAANGFCRKP